LSAISFGNAASENWKKRIYDYTFERGRYHQ